MVQVEVYIESLRVPQKGMTKMKQTGPLKVDCKMFLNDENLNTLIITLF